MKKTIKNYLLSTILCLSTISFWACSSDKDMPEEDTDPVVKTLTVDVNKVDLDSKAGSANVIVATNTTAWSVSTSDASWIKFTPGTGVAGRTTVTITALENTSSVTRTADITISSADVAPVKITVSQAGTTGLYPNYNTNPIAADATGMSSTAVQLAAKMKLGWNIGNTLEATGSETAWGNPKVTKALVDLVKANGFNAIRIPCSWNQYANGATAKITDTWLARVKEVVKYCTDNDMYVIVNIHWDGGWLEENCIESKKEANNAKQKAFWEQIATNLRDFDEHLLFASANEPHVDDATEMGVLNSYHQTFIDAVRSTGGKNAYRTLIVQGPATDIEKTAKLMTTLPTDKVANRMMAEVHFYPYQFTLMAKDEDWGKMFYYWGAGNHSTTDTAHNPTWGEEAFVNEVFLSMKTKFVDKGIPVILGEFGAIRRDLTGDALALHLKSRAAFLKYVVKQSKANGLIPFYWDAGNLGTNTMSLFDRSNNTVYDLQALTALQDGLK
ncbi:cellulase family glycosylhydrolase [Flavobacterium fluviatile]|uniref:cellulase family glycosylhydrolase n=1 Tax=Flavobacterium fluviatile TaxID=1862387 RepID=UPI0013D22616|nr:cellulase family glycosylhydrolase [Flavobacterium fluviatile]